MPDPNPFAPGAGHSPPHLAGRDQEIAEFIRVLDQEIILKNAILTGLRGTGKTVLMDDKYKPAAHRKGWAWVGSDFSEASFVTEMSLCLRLFTDLSVFTSALVVPAAGAEYGFRPPPRSAQRLTFDLVMEFFEAQPGLIVDKLKATLELVWHVLQASRRAKGIVLAYDEAQVVGDRPEKDEYPLALLLEAFQSLQRKGARLFLLLTGLPTLFPRLVESRTYAERMFTVQEIGRLTPEASREAIAVPMRRSTRRFKEKGVRTIIDVSDGYPYFIQFLCKESFDHFQLNPKDKAIPIEAMVRKLDSDFFAGRWENLTERQRDLLHCIAQLKGADEEFGITELVEASRRLKVKKFTPGDVSQILPRLIEKGLMYKNRLGKYCFAVPLFSRFIRRKFARTPKEYRETLF